MAIPKRVIEKLVERDSFSDLLPYISYEDGIYLLSDGSLGFIFEINPLLEIGSDTHRIITGLYNAEFLPPMSTIQWHVFASHNIYPILENWKQRRKNSFGDSERFTEERIKFYIREIRDLLGIPARDFRFLVSVKISQHENLRKGFREFLRGGDIDFGEWEKYIEDVRKIRESVKGILESAFLFPEDLSSSSLIHLLTEFLNPAHDLSRLFPYSEKEEIRRRQIIDYSTKIRVAENGIYLNEHVLKSLTPRFYPEVWSMHDFDELFGSALQALRQIPCYFFLSANFYVLDRERAKASLTAKASVIKHQSFGFLTQFIPRLRLKAENFDVIVQAFENGETVVKGYLNLFIRGENMESAERLKEVASGAWRAKNFELQEDRFIMFPLLLHSLPLGLDPHQDRFIKRAKTIPASAAGTLTPCAFDWRGTREGPLIFFSRRGQTMTFDFFRSATNYNATIFAMSGSGKSFLTSEIISNYLREGAVVFVIDIGRSYEKLCRFLEGDFLVFSEDSNISLNPFSGVEDIEEDMELLKPLLCEMASPSKAMSDLEKSYIERAIKEVWEEKGRNTEIDDVVRKLETMEDPYHRAEDIARMLYPFSRSGQYGKFFQGRANITFEKSLTVIELEELKGKKELQSVVLLLMIYHIGRTMYLGERGRKKLAVIDEAWDLLGGQATADFISHGYRRARKYNGAFISITQSLLDFYRAGSVGEAIIENSAWMLMLRQKGESLEEIKKGKKLLLSGYFEELVESLTTVPGKYSEVFIYGGEQGMGLGRFIVDPFSYWLYTTKADEVALLSRFIKEGLSLESAIEKCIELSKRNGF